YQASDVYARAGLKRPTPGRRSSPGAPLCANIRFHADRGARLVTGDNFMTDIVMPQMGESIVEGTVTKWLKKKGDHVERDEPLFEISTDKVDAEIPSPASGTLAKILVKENETVGVNTVVAVIDGEGVEKPAMAES